MVTPSISISGFPRHGSLEICQRHSHSGLFYFLPFLPPLSSQSAFVLCLRLPTRDQENLMMKPSMESTLVYTRPPFPSNLQTIQRKHLTPTYAEAPPHNLSDYRALTSNSLNFFSAKPTAIIFSLYSCTEKWRHPGKKMSMQFDSAFRREKMCKKY